MTFEVQGRMLLREWFAWWDAMGQIDAEQRLGDYNTLLLGSPGWLGVDREDRIRALYERAYPIPQRDSAPDTRAEGELDLAEANQFRQHSRNVFGWMLSAYGGGVMYSQGQTN